MRKLQSVYVYEMFQAIFNYDFVIQIRNLRRDLARPCPNSVELLRQAWLPRFIKQIHEVCYFEAARFRTLIIIFLVVWCDALLAIFADI